MIAFKIDMSVGTLLECAQQFANPGTANGRWCISRHIPLPRGKAQLSANNLCIQNSSLKKPKLQKSPYPKSFSKHQNPKTLY